MKPSDVPFMSFLGLAEAAPDSGYLLELPENPNLKNHVGTVAAPAQLALAEAASAWVLLKQFGELPGYVPVVRRIESKFSRPAKGMLFAKGEVTGNTDELVQELKLKERLLVNVQVTVHDSAGQITLTAKVDWFVAWQSSSVIHPPGL